MHPGWGDNMSRWPANPIDYWMEQLGTEPDLTHMQQVQWLKTEHGMGDGHANALVAVFRSEHAERS